MHTACRRVAWSNYETITFKAFTWEFSVLTLILLDPLKQFSPFEYWDSDYCMWASSDIGICISPSTSFSFPFTNSFVSTYLQSWSVFRGTTRYRLRCYSVNIKQCLFGRFWYYSCIGYYFLHLCSFVSLNRRKISIRSIVNLLVYVESSAIICLHLLFDNGKPGIWDIQPFVSVKGKTVFRISIPLLLFFFHLVWLWILYFCPVNFL